MQIRIAHGPYGNENASHHIDILDLGVQLGELGYRLTRVERGERGAGVPSLNLNLRNAPLDGTMVTLPVTLRLDPYPSQSALNADVILIGLRQQLDDLYGTNKRDELHVRVFIPNFDGDYLQPGQGDAPELPNRGDRPRDRVMRQIAARRGAPAFRNAQLNRFRGRCAVSGCSLVDVLEAAHIRAYRREQDNAQENGVLLRADLHTLFDLDLLALNPDTRNISVHEVVQEDQYRMYHDHPIRTPDGGFDEAALQARWTAHRRRED
jgi:hypothetical protein